MSPSAALARIARALATLAALIASTACGPEPPAAPALLYLSTLGGERDAASVARLQLQLNRAHPRIGSVPVVVRALPHALDGGPLDEAVAHVLAERPWRMVIASTIAVAIAAQRATAKLPVIFEGAADPQRNCLVDSMTRPGRNATGYVAYLPAGAKMSEALIDAFPGVQTLYVLVDGQTVAQRMCSPPYELPARPPCVSGEDRSLPTVRNEVEAESIATYAASRRRKTIFVRLCDEHDVEDVVRLAAAAKEGGFVVPYQYLFYRQSHELVAALGTTGLPAVYPRSFYTEEGGLMSVAPKSDDDQEARGHQLAVRVLEGDSPAVLPVQRPEGFEMQINLATAAREGLVPSRASLAHADLLRER